MNADTDKVYAIILAAGASSRMGSPKQLLEWRNLPLLERVISNARSLLNERISVVLGAHNEAIQTAIDLGAVATIVNPDWQEGMASSIRVGVNALPASAEAVLILLCDQPLVNATHLQSLLVAWQQAPTHIVASQYHHSVGVPALFPAEFFQHLLALKGDRGAKSILRQFECRLLKIPLPEAELDIDCADDFYYLAVHYSANQ
jgi:molybdenum cofactor cytidylyltransferase